MAAASKLKLFYSPGACSLVPHIMLRASGLPFEVVEANVVKGFPAQYEKYNPKKQVPFMELEPGVILTEVPAIVTAISQLAPEKKILGEPGLETLRSYEWMNYLSGQVHARRFGIFFRPFRFVKDESQFPVVKEMAKANILDSLNLIEGKLKEREPIDPSHLHAVDAFLYAIYRWGCGIGLEMEKDYPVYHERMVEFSKLEPVKKAVEVEGINPFIHGK